MWVCRLPVHIAPAACTGFTEIFGEFVTSHWADRVVGPYGEASMHTYPVGADDSVRPQDISFYENPQRIRNLSLGRCGHRPLRRSFDAHVPRRGGRLCPPAGYIVLRKSSANS